MDGSDEMVSQISLTAGSIYVWGPAAWAEALLPTSGLQTMTEGDRGTKVSLLWAVPDSSDGWL